MKIEKYGAGLFSIEGFLTGQECINYIAMAEDYGYEQATINTSDGHQILKSIRNNDRVIFDDIALSDKLFQRAKCYLLDEIYEWKLSGFNERFRLYKYDKGHYFKWHKDGTYARSKSEESMLTFMIYLNEGYEGGLTRFQWERIKPKTGMALVFPHRLLHESTELENGTKYVLRTDVMYRDK